ncbi:ABC transporter substrate-binding protein [Cellulosilyticum sp. I15G10I2]|uniref:ABC transporter substrate-binding protein n=1 Tax=Cellulosilyticum sp. I15G10I2 TaxID=1892843 RepID=UPI00085BD14A|nr:ABC transporter substrate-binding protein [Cellulosilyticum sp. I15G10I2]
MQKRLLAHICVSFLLIFSINAAPKITYAGELINPISSKYIPIIVQRESPYWEAIRAGAEKAAKDYDVNILIEAPKSPPPTALNEQLNLFRNALATMPPAVILSALDTEAFTPYLEQAQEQNIPVIALDSNVDSPIIRISVATDNYKAGELAAHRLAELVGGKGKVGILTHRTGITSALNRRSGFVITLVEKYPDIEILPIQYGIGTTESLIEGAKTLLMENPDIKGIFGTNRDATEVIINTAKELGKIDSLKIIGFDASKMISEAIRKGIVSGAIAQDPVNMGYKAVESAIKASAGEDLPVFINTGFFWYDSSNIDDPRIKVLLYE